MDVKDRIQHNPIWLGQVGLRPVAVASSSSSFLSAGVLKLLVFSQVFTIEYRVRHCMVRVTRHSRLQLLNPTSCCCNSTRSIPSRIWSLLQGLQSLICQRNFLLLFGLAVLVYRVVFDQHLAPPHYHQKAECILEKKGYKRRHHHLRSRTSQHTSTNSEEKSKRALHWLTALKARREQGGCDETKSPRIAIGAGR